MTIYAYGEQNPTQGETPVGWSNFSDGSGGEPRYSSDWGYSIHDLGTGNFGPVHDFGSVAQRWIKIIRERYGSDSGNSEVFFRWSEHPFLQNDILPLFEIYSGPGKVTRTFQYLQVYPKGGQVT